MTFQKELDCCSVNICNLFICIYSLRISIESELEYQRAESYNERNVKRVINLDLNSFFFTLIILKWTKSCNSYILDNEYCKKEFNVGLKINCYTICNFLSSNADNRNKYLVFIFHNLMNYNYSILNVRVKFVLFPLNF